MNKIKHILVALDFSEYTPIAILRAIHIAKLNNAKITLLHIAKESFIGKTLTNTIPMMGKVLITPEEHATSLLEKITKKYLKEKITMEYAILSGEHPAHKILQYAKKSQSDLIIVGAHSQYSFHDWFVGTTAEYIARKTPIPVLIIKRKTKNPYKKILVPLDFSHASKNALLLACKLFPDSKLKLLHIGDHEFEELLKNKIDISHTKVKTIQKSLLLLLSQKMKDFISKVNKKLSNISFDIKFGYPGITILEEAKKSNQDLVIMGTEGHSERHYLFIGRTASRVLIDVDRDLLLVPPQKLKFRINGGK